MAIRITRQEPMVLQFARSLQSLDISAQQREAAMLIGRGFANPQIAEAMGLSVNTIAYHIKQLLQRLEAHGRADLIERVINLSKAA